MGSAGRFGDPVRRLTGARPAVREDVMILRQYLTLTAQSPPVDVRRAIVRALEGEVPRSPEAYDRFYRRVIAQLGETGPSEHTLSEHAA